MENRISDIHIARNIARLRHKMGMTQAELADKLYVSNKTVSKWERGAGYPEMPQLVRLADLFGVTVDTLIRGEKNGIAVAGNILTDEVKMVEAFPERGMLVNITAMSRAVGGSVPNTLISLAKIDPTLSLAALGKRGDDEGGRYAQSELQRNGIDTSGVLVTANHPTGFSDVMTLEGTGERTFFHHRGANAHFVPSDIPISTLTCRMLHVAYIHLLDGFDAHDPEYGTALARFLKSVQEAGILTSVDVVSNLSERFSEVVIAALPYTDNAIMNEIEACGVSGLAPRDGEGKLIPENIRATMELLMSHGVGQRVIVHCPEAGFCLSKDGSFTVVPSLKLPEGYIKGTVGAGDSFCAGCLYGIYNGYSDRDILEFASGAAACNLSAADSVSGMRDAGYIRELIDTYEKVNL
ncbi:MAG: helix-turn-helix domain-containing protein [Clostridia bacterium]|nr:helix-turn-helix domain-containing protein [Clostridia bacterium]